MSGKSKQPVLEKKFVKEVFTDCKFLLVNSLKNFKTPNCFNGTVLIHKYRVTVELIEEPIEVYKERIEQLYSKSDNWHHREPLQAMAKQLGITIDSKFGSAKKEKNNAL